MNNLKNKLKLTFVFILAILAFFVFFKFFQKETVKIIPLSIESSVPANGSDSVSVFDPIIIKFNQNINSKDLYISSEPFESWDISQYSPNSIQVNHQEYLRVATQYKLLILKNGTLIGTITFKTAHEQNDPRFLQTLQSELNKDYPLISLTPYETSNYKVVYIAPLTLEIELKNQMDQQTVISQVKLWVKSNGIDPSTHKYNVIKSITTQP